MQQPATAETSEAMKMMLYDANKKSTGVTYLLWFFLGGFGIHRFYLGHTASAVGILVLTLLGFVTFFVTWIATGIWLLVDLFLIPGMVRNKNNALIHGLQVAR